MIKVVGSEPSNLKALQTALGRVIMQPLEGDSIAIACGDRATSEIAIKMIKPSLKMDSLSRLEIYCQQYWYRLLDSMEEDFPGVAAMLGEERFRELCVRYLSKHQSSWFSLQKLGSCFFDFVNVESGLISEDLRQAVLDTIKFEWAEIEAFEAEQKEALDLSAIAGLEPTQIYLSVQPHVHVLSLDHAVDTFLLKLKKTVREVEVSTASLNKPRKHRKLIRPPQEVKTFVVVYRLANSIYYKRISKAHHAILTGLKSGESLMSAFERLSERNFESKNLQLEATAFQEAFFNWTSLGWFCVAGNKPEEASEG